MPVILINKTAFETYFNECKVLSQEISQTSDQIASVETQLLSEGFKKPNVKKLILDAKKLNKPLAQVNFKNTSGTLTVSPTQTDSALDTNIRSKLVGVFDKDVSPTLAEPIKRKLLSDKIKLSKNYGIPSAVFQKTINLVSNQSVFVSQSEVIISLQNCCLVNITDANIDMNNLPANPETDSIVDDASLGII